MYTFLILSLLSYAIVNILVFGSIFQSMRDWFQKINPSFLGKLTSCPMCSGAWVGFTLSYIFQYLNLQTPLTLYGVNILWISVFLDGCLMSGTTWLIHNLEEMCERAFVKGVTEIKIIKNDSELEKEMD